MKADKSVVGALFGMSGPEFHEHFPRELVIRHERVAAAAELFAMPEMQDVHSLLSSWKGSVGLHPRGLSDDSRIVLVPPGVAREFVRMGCNLSFNFMNLFVPGLDPWLRRLRDELALPRSTASKCLGFFSSKGSGTVPHFDNRMNISVQIQGRKEWRFAPNTNVVDPDFRCVIDDSRAVLLGDRPELQVAAPLPTKMPEEGLQIATFAPGSVGCIPRGYWHATYAVEDSLSFNFWFETQDWRRVVVQAIADRLVRLPQWRALAKGGGRDGAIGALARESLEGLLRSLPDDIGELTVDDVLKSIRPAIEPVGGSMEWYEQIFDRGWIRYAAGERP